MYMTERMNGIRIAAIAIFTTGATLGVSAQQQPQVAEKPLEQRAAVLRAELSAPLDLARPAELSYSSSVGAAETESAESFSFGNQPPPRRTYGRHPNYSDKMHNADGSNKWAFQVGGGFTLPVGGTHNYYKTSWAFQGGVGRNFNKNLGVLLNFSWANFGIQTHTLDTLLATYNRLLVAANLQPFNQLGGYGHVWSFSLEPVYNVFQGDASGLYVTGGVGFYHKYTAFTIPSTAYYCDIFGFCYAVAANQRVDWYTSNAVGFDGGFGYTYRFSRFGSERLFAEVKYVYTANSRRPYWDGTGPNPVPSNPNYFNVFPQGSAPTTFIPITFGIKF
jgi:hypothetical protein